MQETLLRTFERFEALAQPEADFWSVVRQTIQELSLQATESFSTQMNDDILAVNEALKVPSLLFTILMKEE